MPNKTTIFDIEQHLYRCDDLPKEARKLFRRANRRKGQLNIELMNGDDVLPAPAKSARRPTQYAFKDIPGGIGGWLIRIEVMRRLQRYDAKIADNPKALKIVAEGDSWFQHPLIHDLIDYLEKEDDLAVLSLASGGSELGQMIDPKDYLVAVKKERPTMFLLSAGGNDFLGNLGDYIQPWKPQARPANPTPQPEPYIKAEFDSLLETIAGWLHEVISDVLTVSSVRRVILHGYDYPIPNSAPSTALGPKAVDRTGDWISGPMNALRITDDYLRRMIVRNMLDRYCARVLKVIADGGWGDKVRFVDFRDSLTREDQWFDEIHPDDAQFKRLSKKLLKAIKAA